MSLDPKDTFMMPDGRCIKITEATREDLLYMVEFFVVMSKAQRECYENELEILCGSPEGSPYDKVIKELLG